MVSADQKPLVAQRGVAAEHDRRSRRHSASSPSTFAIIVDRLRPAGGRRILRADAAAHRQRRAAVRVRIVEDDADIAPVRIAAGAAHAEPSASSSGTPSESSIGRER